MISVGMTRMLFQLKPFQDFNLQKGPHLHDMFMSSTGHVGGRFNRLGGKKMESCGYAEAWSQRIVMQFTKIHRMGCEKCPLFWLSDQETAFMAWNLFPSP